MKLMRKFQADARKKSVIVVFSILTTVFLAGCETTNFVSQFYTDYTAGVPKDLVEARLLPYSGNTLVRSSNNLKSDHNEMLRNNYVLIGLSGFTGSNLNVSNAMMLEQAKKVKADYVMHYSGYLGAEQGSRPVLNYNPGQTSTTTSYGNVNANAYGTGGYAYGSANYTGTSTTNTMGTLSVSHVPATLHRYEYSVAFYRKGTPATFGAMTENLSDELRKKYGRNTGVVITTVLYNTPAFLSNFFEGDVIIAANGQDVSSVDGFWQVLNQYAGQDCAITVLRQNEKITIPVKFNAQGSSYSTNSPTQRNSNNEGIDKIEARGSDANKTRYTNTSPGIADEDDARERRLRNLIKMRDGKLITEEEYQQMRKKVLDEI